MIPRGTVPLTAPDTELTLSHVGEAEVRVYVTAGLASSAKALAEYVEPTTADDGPVIDTDVGAMSVATSCTLTTSPLAGLIVIVVCESPLLAGGVMVKVAVDEGSNSTDAKPVLPVNSVVLSEPVA